MALAACPASTPRLPPAGPHLVSPPAPPPPTKPAPGTKTGSAAAPTVRPRGEESRGVRAAPPLDAGTWVVGFEYTGKLDVVNTAGAFKQTVAGSSYVYTQLEALYARWV